MPRTPLSGRIARPLKQAARPMKAASRHGLLYAAAIAALSSCGARTALRIDPDVPVIDVPVIDVPVPPIDLPGPDSGDPGCLVDPSRCDDRDLCTVDTCLDDGRCAHAPVACDDGDACTDDRCEPALGCFTTATDCDDRSLCTDDRCDRALGCLHAVVACDDRDPCTANRCEPARGCVFPATDCGGCADGVRDAFLDRASHPVIAGCAGGFTNAGLSRESSPTCARGAGDDGPNPTGSGCSATDLCAPGWHVCRSAQDVAAHSPDGCGGARDAAAGTFYATRQTGPGCGHCATGADATCGSNDCRTGCAQTDRTSNDIFGCGTLGDSPQASSCGPLDRFSQNLCTALRAPWRCDGDRDGLRESDLVVKPGPEAGGVLCCLD
ncbi:MAG: hypothetical protein Q8S73_17180 [Deltaproteobacteria bacterium]|nr:hypothetical protein [Myxococcales bacterium]MDP3215843.1 hypothetical protein [Deltaproteobacteria bacterium]